MTEPHSTSLPVAAAPDAADESGPEYDENGVELSLIRYSLALTPTERLKAVENFMNAMASVRPVSSPADTERAK